MPDPSPAPVVVIGGGIIGLCCALQVRRLGFAVTLVDPGDPEAAASFGNAGQLAVGEVVPLAGPGVLASVPRWLADPLGPLAIRWRYLPRIAPWLIAMVRASAPKRAEEISEAMQSLSDRMMIDYEGLLAEAGAQAVVQPGTHLRVFETRQQFEAESWGWKMRCRTGQRSDFLDAAALHALEPDFSAKAGFAVAFPGRSFVIEPLQLTRAFQARLREAGGEIVIGRATGFVREGDAVTAVTLADGTRLAASQVVVAAGARSHFLTAQLGDRLPLETERGYHVVLPDPGVTLHHSVSYVPRGFSLTPMATGLRLAGTVEFAGLDAPPNWNRARKLVEVARTLLPGLRTEGMKMWMGHRPAFPDSLPVIDRASKVRNVTYAFGHGHFGLSWAATTGRLIASLVADTPTNTDLAPFRAARFSKAA